MASTLVWRLTGGAANADPNASLGGVSSANNISDTALGALFDDVSEAESAAGDVEYRALDLFNTGAAAVTAVTVYITSDTTNPDTSLDVGIEAAPLGSTTAIADEGTAPAGVTFSHPTEGSRLNLPDIPAGGYARVWFRRTVDADAINSANDTVSWTAAGA